MWNDKGRQKMAEMIKGLGKDRFILLFLIGILIVIIAIPLDKSKESNKKNSESANENSDQSIETNETDTKDETERYAELMEEKLTEVLESMDGVGEVRVFITMQSSKEKIYAKNTPYTRKNEEREENGETTVTTETENQSEIVLYEQEDGSQSPLVAKEMVPLIQGVVVVAEGGNKESIKQNISEVLQALFGIDEHKIKVVKLNRKSSKGETS